MFEARLSESKLLKNVIEALKDLLSQAQWECDNSGISMQAMDGSHSTLVSLVLLAEGFDTYRCDSTFTMGINLVTMGKLLKCAAGDDMLVLKAEDDADVLSMTFEAPNSERVSEYQMKLMEIDAEHLGIPDTKFSVVVKMPAPEFARICRDMASLSDTVNITCTKDGIMFKSQGDLGSGSVKLSQTQSVDKPEESVSIELSAPVSLTFSLKYLNMFCKAGSLSNSVVLSMSPDIPMVVEYKIGDSGHIRYYLAPRIEDEGEAY